MKILNKVLLVIIMIGVLVSSSGCASLEARSKEKEPSVYPFRKVGFNLLDPFGASVDVILSPALDTVLLPIDIIRVIAKGSGKGDKKPKEEKPKP